MGNVLFSDQGPRLTTELVRALEAKIGRTLPKNYLQFLYSHNGGVPSRRGFIIPEVGDEDLLDFFLGVGHPNSTMDMLRYVDSLPNYVRGGLLPIGCTAGASFIAIDLCRGESVVYLDIADPMDENDQKDGHRLASDIWEFCRQLRA